MGILTINEAFLFLIPPPSLPPPPKPSPPTPPLSHVNNLNIIVIPQHPVYVNPPIPPDLLLLLLLAFHAHGDVRAELGAEEILA